MCDVAKTYSFEAKPRSYAVVKGMKIVMKSQEVLLPHDSLVFGIKPKPASSSAARTAAAAARVFPRNVSGSIASHSVHHPAPITTQS